MYEDWLQNCIGGVCYSAGDVIYMLNYYHRIIWWGKVRVGVWGCALTLNEVSGMSGKSRGVCFIKPTRDTQCNLRTLLSSTFPPSCLWLEYLELHITTLGQRVQIYTAYTSSLFLLFFFKTEHILERFVHLQLVPQMQQQRCQHKHQITTLPGLIFQYFLNSLV